MWVYCVLLTVEGPGQGPCVLASQRSTLCPWNVAASSPLDFAGILPVISPYHCHLCTCFTKTCLFTEVLTTSQRVASSPQLHCPCSSHQWGPSSGSGTQDAGPRNPPTHCCWPGLALAIDEDAPAVHLAGSEERGRQVEGTRCQSFSSGVPGGP